MSIQLTDRQLLAVTGAAAALCPSDRDQFYQAVAHQLASAEVGDGSVHRAVAAAFQAFWKPPEMPHTPSRWERGTPRFEKTSRRAY
jgi:hypothetical protein